MSSTTPAPTGRDPIESKVKWSTLWAFLLSLALALVNALVGNSQMMGALPPWLQFIIVAAAPTLATFAAGYQAHHTPRTGRRPGANA